MTRFFLPLAASLVLLGCGTDAPTGGSTTHSHDGSTHTHQTGGAAAEAEVPRFAYLGMNGTFEMDPVQAATRNDARNPSRIRLVTTDEKNSTSRMAFYDHADSQKLVADCAYQYTGSQPDPHYFPEFKTSIWDVFTLVESYEGACDDYQTVISRSPHGDPGHMHLRYGAEDAQTLLAMSNAPVDSTRYEPWWPLFCEEGTTESCE